jgi:hypothetical protein
VFALLLQLDVASNNNIKKNSNPHAKLAVVEFKSRVRYS